MYIYIYKYIYLYKYVYIYICIYTYKSHIDCNPCPANVTPFYDEKNYRSSCRCRGGFFANGITTTIGFHYSTLVYEGVYNRLKIFLMQPEP